MQSFTAQRSPIRASGLRIRGVVLHKIHISILLLALLGSVHESHCVIFFTVRVKGCEGRFGYSQLTIFVPPQVDCISLDPGHPLLVDIHLLVWERVFEITDPGTVFHILSGRPAVYPLAHWMLLHAG